MKKGTTLSALDQINIYLIYIFWWFAQIALLMVLLNFVIALISQYYEDVMNSAEMHTYMQRQQLNHEYYVYQEFKVQMGWTDDDNIDALLLITGEEADEGSEWKGLTQTMNRNFVKVSDQTKLEVKQQVALVK